jgi:ADP-heptose:LPS heptosyltransferase
MRALVVNMNYFGDALMTTPTLRLLASVCGRPVDVIAGGVRGYAAVEVLRDSPSVGELIPRVDGAAFARCLQLFRAIRSGKYDLVVILPSIGAYLWTARLAGARRIIYVPQMPAGLHMAEHMLHSVASALNVHVGAPRMSLTIGEDSQTGADSLLSPLAGKRGIVGLNVGASRPQKRWPVAAFRAVARRLSERGFGVVLLGSPSDKTIASQILDGEKGDPAVIDLTGRTSIGELCAIIARVAALVSADTGAMHIAAALETPIVALFGSTDPGQTGPVGSGGSVIITKSLPCSPCKSRPTCNGVFSCMSLITPIEVLNALDSFIEPAVELPRFRIVSS